jgi:hypothetical protein
MKPTHCVALLVSLLLGYGAESPGQSTDRTSSLPHLQKQGSAQQLVVEGRPLLMLAGELGNSSASDLASLNAIWLPLKQMHLNTVLIPAYWELLESREGAYDFTLIDSAIAGARNHGLKIVFLWFGTWKNSMSCYAPYWVKTDLKRFPRAFSREGKAQEIVTPFSDEGRKIDARAFAVLMKHIREIDREQQTVIMVQVENEIGMLPDARDHGPLADKTYAGQVPPELMAYLRGHRDALTPELSKLWGSAGFKTSGTWEEVFGQSIETEEVFMAWYFAKYTDFVADAGKKEYPLPMYVNAALIRAGYKPGQYPSAGPLPHLMDIWKAAAPNIDFLSPDIYHGSFAGWTGKFAHPNNPLFIPEVGNDQSVANAYYAFAELNGIGYSPFSIESLPDPTSNQLARGYAVLQQLAPIILQNQGKGTMVGILLDSAAESRRVDLGDFRFTFRHEYSWPYAARSEAGVPRFGGLIVSVSRDEFLIAGRGIVVTFEPAGKAGATAGIADIEEGTFVDGKWVAGRRLNGDQSHQGRHLHIPGDAFGIQRVRLYTY